MKTTRLKWRYLGKPSHRGHRFYENLEEEDGFRIYVADDSGPDPDQTDDGALYVAIPPGDDPLVLEYEPRQGIFLIPVRRASDGAGYRILSDPTETAWLIRKIRDIGLKRDIRTLCCDTRSANLRNVFAMTQEATGPLG